MSLKPNTNNNSELRTDLLPESLTETPDQIRIIAQQEFQRVIEDAEQIPLTTTPRPTKNIVEVMELISKAFIDYETRTNAAAEVQIRVTYERPDLNIDLETISMELIKRDPGMFGRGRPGGNSIQNRRPILREIINDPDNPGYKRAVMGFWYDNTLQLTCWARTAKTANERALWLEDVMEEYAWFFAYSGINRLLYDGRRSEVVHDISNNRIYGRPVNYFVRTEKIRNVSQKTLELIQINMSSLVNEVNVT